VLSATFSPRKLHSVKSIFQLNKDTANVKSGGTRMLRLTVSPEEYLMINNNIKIVFLGGSKNNMRIMVDAPKEVSIVRSTALENRIPGPEERAKLPRFYAVAEKQGKQERHRA